MMRTQPTTLSNAFIAFIATRKNLTIFFPIFFAWMGTTTYVQAQTNEIILTNTGANQTWKVPDCVYEITVEAWGAGGGGGFSSIKLRTTGGGGGGAYVRSVLQVGAGNEIQYQIGAGGSGASGDSAGGDSWFMDHTILMAQGGRGVSINSSSGGQGGQKNASVGDIKNSGGNGADGQTYDSGGGGAAGSLNQDGNDGNGSQGGTSIYPAGNGGDGDSSDGGDGEHGVDYGGGGGGAKKAQKRNEDRMGGNGAQGLIRITYSTDAITWNGSQNRNWYNPNNWTPASVPSRNSCVIIPSTLKQPSIYGAQPTLPLPAEAASLSIEVGAELEIQSVGGNLIVGYAINNAGQFIIRNNGSLIQLTDAPNTGSIQMERKVSGISNLHYVYWSSPVEGFKIKDIAPSVNKKLIFEWLPTIAGNPGEHGNWQNYKSTMQVGKGYIVRGLSGATDETAKFIGVPHNGTITVPISRGENTGTGSGSGTTDYTATDDNWNLIGNPYPSAISADRFILANAGVISDTSDPAIAGTVYLWDHEGKPIGDSTENPFYGNYVYNYQASNYVSYNMSGSNPSRFNGDIAAGQAFFVLMEDTGARTQNVVFNNAMRGNGSLNNSQFMRSTQSGQSSATNDIERHRIWLDIVNSKNTATSLMVGYIEGATDGMDRLYDGLEMNGTGLRFYSLIDDNMPLSIQGMSLPFDVSDRIPLGFDLTTAGTYTIAINAMDGLFKNSNQGIYIEDTYTNAIHNLTKAPYTLHSESGRFNDRFVLRFSSKTLSVDTVNYDSQVRVYKTNDALNITSPNETIESAMVYDILGRKVDYKEAVNATTLQLPLPQQGNGTLVVLVRLTNGRQVSKKIMF